MTDAKKWNLKELSAATRENLKSLGYGLRTIQMANSIWRDLGQFLGGRCEDPFLPVFGLEYLHDRIDYPGCLERKLTPDERDYIRAVRMLTSFQENGTIPDALKRARSSWYEPVSDIRSAYVHHCESVFRTRATKRSRIAAADRFMQIIMVNRGISVSELSPQIISEYVAGMSEYSKATVEVHLRGLRCFFLFLFETGKTAQDLSESVPKLHGCMGEKIPHTLSTEQVNLILESIDRGSPIGKRNYAVLLMAACLGMRDSDITNLMFENIDWERSTISFFQKKTNKHLTLPLLPIVGEAIIDYLKNGRPPTDSRYIFVKHRPPFRQAVSFYSIMKIALEDAGIKLDANVSRGLHILRHSLASELVRQGESYQTISTILGHTSIGSTNAYTHIDVDGLFKCALELTEVTGSGG